MNCVYCGEKISATDERCPSCGAYIDPEQLTEEKKRKRFPWEAVTVAALCLLIIVGSVFVISRVDLLGGVYPDGVFLKYVCDYDEGVVYTNTYGCIGDVVCSMKYEIEIDMAELGDEAEALKAECARFIKQGDGFDSFGCNYYVEGDTMYATVIYNDLNSSSALEEYVIRGLLDKTSAGTYYSMSAIEKLLYDEGYILYNGDEPDLSDLDRAIFVWSDTKNTSAVVIYYRYDITYKREHYLSSDSSAWSDSYKLEWLQSEREKVSKAKNLSFFDYEELITDNRLYTKQTINGLYDVNNIIDSQYAEILSINGFSDDFHSYISVAKTTRSLEALGYTRNDEFDLDSLLPDEDRDAIDDDPPYFDEMSFEHTYANGWKQVFTYEYYDDIVYTIRVKWSKNCSGWSEADYEGTRKYFADVYEPVKDCDWLEVNETVENNVYYIEVVFNDMHVPENLEEANKTSVVTVGDDFRRISMVSWESWHIKKGHTKVDD